MYHNSPFDLHLLSEIAFLFRCLTPIIILTNYWYLCVCIDIFQIILLQIHLGNVGIGNISTIDLHLKALEVGHNGWHCDRSLTRNTHHRIPNCNGFYKRNIMLLQFVRVPMCVYISTQQHSNMFRIYDIYWHVLMCNPDET